MLINNVAGGLFLINRVVGLFLINIEVGGLFFIFRIVGGLCLISIVVMTAHLRHNLISDLVVPSAKTILFSRI